MDQKARSQIATAIDAACEAAEVGQRESVRLAVECGRILISAKETIPNGEWAAWLRLNTLIDFETAQIYMQFARYVDHRPADSQSTTDMWLRSMTFQGPSHGSVAVSETLSPEVVQRQIISNARDSPNLSQAAPWADAALT